MFRSPWELDAQIRYRIAHLDSERRLCSRIDRADAGWPRRLTHLRRRLGLGLIRVGATIAGSDGLRGLPTPPAWPELANR